MEYAFYIAAVVAVLATLRVITHTNPVHALLYLIVSLLAISAVFFSLGAYFAAALEIIVYAGAIMVLFVFVVMMLNLDQSVERQERAWLTPQAWIGPAFLALVLLIVVLYTLRDVTDYHMRGSLISAKEVGISLFGPYVLVVELASLLLLAGLVVAYHLGRENRSAEAASAVADGAKTDSTNKEEEQ
ncbi:MAG: NADH-quinone oxidoreductase subunit J [Enterobacteriaceae bacterium]